MYELLGCTQKQEAVLCELMCPERERGTHTHNYNKGRDFLRENEGFVRVAILNLLYVYLRAPLHS